MAAEGYGGGERYGGNAAASGQGLLTSQYELAADLTIGSGTVWYLHDLVIDNGVTLKIADGAEVLLL